MRRDMLLQMWAIKDEASTKNKAICIVRITDRAQNGHDILGLWVYLHSAKKAVPTLILQPFTESDNKNTPWVK